MISERAGLSEVMEYKAATGVGQRRSVAKREEFACMIEEI